MPHGSSGSRGWRAYSKRHLGPKVADVTIEDCAIENNGQRSSDPNMLTIWGGGVMLDTAPGRSQSIARSIVRNNKAAEYGGGIHMFFEGSSSDGVPVTVESCVIADNVSRTFGGGISARYGVAPKLLNCTIAGNDASNGGGLWSYAAHLTVENSVVWGNAASTLGPQISTASDTTVRFSDIEGGRAGIFVEPGFNLDWQLSNIVVDPAFVNAPNGDYHLSGGASPSPCIDAADSRLAVGLLDVERHPRIVNCTADMGAFEYAPVPDCPGPDACPCSANIRVDSNNDGVINAADDLVANVSPGVVIYVNDDDDNFNGVPDLEESPVDGENDLAEVRLCADCYPLNPATAWWSISWTGNPSLAVWLAPDKSLPAPPLGSLVNGAQQACPPPPSAWVEALSASAAATVADSATNGLDITFRVSDNGLGAQANDTVTASAESTIQINLRTVMFVENGALLNAPPNPTGGSKLTQAQVGNIALNFVNRFGGTALYRAGFRIRYSLDHRIIKLQSACMNIGLEGAMCGDLHTTLNNPRLVYGWWLGHEVVGEGGGTAAALTGPCPNPPPATCCDGDQSHGGCPGANLCCDGFDAHLCTYNVYHIGFFLADAAAPISYNRSIAAVTRVGSDPEFDWTSIFDGAMDDLWGNPDRIDQDRYLLHEFVCHWLAADLSFDHTPIPPECDPGPCELKTLCPHVDLCSKGVYNKTCRDAHYPNDDIDLSVNFSIITRAAERLAVCGGSP